MYEYASLRAVICSGAAFMPNTPFADEYLRLRQAIKADVSLLETLWFRSITGIR